MNISMDKKYMLDGENFTVLTVTKPGEMPVLGYTPFGTAYECKADGTSRYGSKNLVEVNPYADFVIDEPVMARDYDTENWTRQYFAGMRKGFPNTWWGGGTKWSTTNTATISWNQCRRPTAKELAK